MNINSPGSKHSKNYDSIHNKYLTFNTHSEQNVLSVYFQQPPRYTVVREQVTRIDHNVNNNKVWQSEVGFHVCSRRAHEIWCNKHKAGCQTGLGTLTGPPAVYGKTHGAVTLWGCWTRFYQKVTQTLWSHKKDLKKHLLRAQTASAAVNWTHPCTASLKQQ